MEHTMHIHIKNPYYEKTCICCSDYFFKRQFLAAAGTHTFYNIFTAIFLLSEIQNLSEKKWDWLFKEPTRNYAYKRLFPLKVVLIVKASFIYFQALS